MRRVLVAGRSGGFAESAGGVLAKDRDFNVVALPTSGSIDIRLPYDVALIDADLAAGFLAALSTHDGREQPPRVVVIADDDDGARATELLRLGASAWVHRGESVGTLIETIHAVSRGEARLPQPLLGQLLNAVDRPALAEPPGARIDARLTPREMEILGMLEQGIGRSEIAAHLHLSPNTVRTHIQHILNRLGVHSTLAAVAYIRAENANTEGAVLRRTGA
jgi:DNA-binding NarL/FixJ family response regulator